MRKHLPFIVGVLITILISFACTPGVGVYPNTGKPTVKGLPPVFSAGVWTLPWDNDERVDGLQMVITRAGEIKITKDNVPMPHKIKNGRILLSGDLHDCYIYASGTDKIAAIVVAGWGFWGRHLRDLGKFSCITYTAK
ncbi:MAG: hypothetical protein K9K66_04700 [Desulfarculaceae bacterium]|nr:hypothetical protein [Desulfarculaceae bacterium]MCF8072771.1 hypothetical protein [Desulfarculaceae bacterium]MCF8100939.1 hypothetical protein [Desulfarculaceae bacterium]MCF8117577.1 hypothetical protein [Desulfarculaceae bacterium]